MRKFLMLALLALPVFSANAEETVHIGLNTSEGYIELALDKEKAPISVENFVTYVEEGHYDGTIFHRVIKNFMIQGGGFDASMNRKPTRAAIKNEAKNGLKNKRGSVAMARTASVDSATSQFFINVKDNTFLDHGVRDYGYAVFGEVVKGMDVVDKITETRVGRRDQPAEDIIINSAVIVEKESEEAPAPLIEN
ncbi:MAG: peptidylprolyl isomerase A [Oceanospirillaceae bacterium]|jgi:peptidyl-prolyl cis-trans isomerase A (cyclophilin A)|uniref:peptidylprolyl isomerase n=2 Tax=unclassified Thalassolituus TaxID=2624967 RepID=UPI000C6A5DCD|nr:peptidylprolyl isomerase A [Oceanospirillaceae bacterium]MED5441928.1 peptidylprolyl isomerase [Pseudomonadota bacterium]MEE3209109.1 peptidylprolyl isomerase [Pseudomonadota bacterium]|tara:strand:- start:834 stop:1415 length:582 start_codon:yes stop_codon:yes gene_type:complete